MASPRCSSAGCWPAISISVRGDYVTLTSPQGNLTPFGMLPRSRRFRVAGIFDSGFYDYDANWGFVNLATAQSLAGVGDVVSLLEIRVAKAGRRESKIAADVLRRAGKGFTVTTWMDENRALFRALEPRKTSDRALHRADHICRRAEYSGRAHDDGSRSRPRHRRVDGHGCASRSKSATSSFCRDSVVSIAGTAVGLSLGYLFAFVANRWQLIPLNPEVYAIPYVPFHANGFDSVWIALAALADQHRRHHAPRAVGFAHPAGRNSPL